MCRKKVIRKREDCGCKGHRIIRKKDEADDDDGGASGGGSDDGVSDDGDGDDGKGKDDLFAGRSQKAQAS